MQLDKENIRKLQGLIVFTLVILVGLLRFDVVLDALGFILHILSPFILGGAIAFVLSVPMNRIQKRLFELFLHPAEDRAEYFAQNFRRSAKNKL